MRLYTISICMISSVTRTHGIIGLVSRIVEVFTGGSEVMRAQCVEGVRGKGL